MTTIRKHQDSLQRAASVATDSDDHWYSSPKNRIDLWLALMLAVGALPMVLSAMLAVRLTSRGPAIYSQRRVGRNGRTFAIYKVRSMYLNCESASGPVWSPGKGDRRITPIGRFLRVTHLDELPQLWNVLRGDMSLVGPRPERPEFVEALERAIPGYADRHKVRPGVTGLAQLQLPPDTGIECVRRKLMCDFHYIQEQSLWLDLRVIAATSLAMFGVPFRFVGWFFRIPRAPEPPPVLVEAGALSVRKEGVRLEPVADVPVITTLPHPQSV